MEACGWVGGCGDIQGRYRSSYLYTVWVKGNKDIGTLDTYACISFYPYCIRVATPVPPSPMYGWMDDGGVGT